MMIYAPNSVKQEKLEEVKAEMMILGAPKIRAYYDGEKYLAIEGSHRIAAAHDLDILPEIIELDWEEVISDHDMEDLDDEATVEDIIDYLYSGNIDAVYEF